MDTPSRDRVLAASEAALIALQRGAALFTPPTSTEAACPHCGRVRGVVMDGSSTRCYGCWRAWVPTLAPVVA